MISYDKEYFKITIVNTSIRFVTSLQTLIHSTGAFKFSIPVLLYHHQLVVDSAGGVSVSDVNISPVIADIFRHDIHNDILFHLLFLFLIVRLPWEP